MRGAEGVRTPDPHTASVVRYQLRYSPVVLYKLPDVHGVARSRVRPFLRGGSRARPTFVVADAQVVPLVEPDAEGVDPAAAP